MLIWSLVHLYSDMHIKHLLSIGIDFDVTLLFMKSLRQKSYAFVLKTITVDVLKSIT